MRFPRASGLNLHPTSLPGGGIGDLGAEAHAFIDWLHAAGQKIWQVLPLGPPGYGESPYQGFSAFAGNPLLIDLHALGYGGAGPGEGCQADFSAAARWKRPLLEQAAREFYERGAPAQLEHYEDFCHRHAAWLEDYALFMGLKDAFGGAAWTQWEPRLAQREPAAIESWSERLCDVIRAHKYAQYVFFSQWLKLKERCAERGIRILGDIPIYVAHDSADVWANPELFHLDDSGNPLSVAGVPPDYFSATGQLWGNPLYRWDVIARRGYGWWIDRFRAALGLVDLVRLDHFRGFEAYWEVEAGADTAIRGRWVKAPGEALFTALEAALGELPIIAENLGVITPEVEAIRERFGFPGMAVLQFAFGNDPQGPDFRPHNYPRNRVAYSGTHDNDTTVGWWTSSGAGDSTRTPEDIAKERAFAKRYLATDGTQINWVFIRALMASVADTVMFPVQDVLGLGSEARMNLPGTSGGRNWKWRFNRGDLTPQLAARLRAMAETYERG